MRIVTIIPLLLAVGALAVACDFESDAAETGTAEDGRPPLVRVAPVEMREVRREISTTGYLESERRVTILSKVSGRITEVLVDEGDQVTEGQIMARIDDRELRATISALAIQLEERHVRVNLAELEIDAAKHRLEQARIARDRAKTEYDRLTSQPPGIVAQKSLDEAKFSFDSAVEALGESGFLLRKAQLDKKSAENAVEELKARKLEAEVRLADHIIVAPFDGAVVECNVRIGQTVTVRSLTQMFTVVDMVNLISYLSRPQVQLPLVQRAKEVVFTTDAYGDREFTADVDLVSPVIDEATGHFRIRMRVRQDDVADLRPGMFIRARVMTEESRTALMVPKAAVLAEGEQSIVFAVRNGRAFQIVLNPGLEEQSYVECLNRGDGGLEDTDVVIVAGHDDMTDQTVVEVSKG